MSQAQINNAFLHLLLPNVLVGILTLILFSLLTPLDAFGVVALCLTVSCIQIITLWFCLQGAMINWYYEELIAAVAE